MNCRPFDASAEGTWASNGLGCVVLRRLRDALLSGDPIISVILSSAVNNDGEVGYTAPSVAGQQGAGFIYQVIVNLSNTSRAFYDRVLRSGYVFTRLKTKVFHALQLAGSSSVNCRAPW